MKFTESDNASDDLTWLLLNQLIVPITGAVIGGLDPQLTLGATVIGALSATYANVGQWRKARAREIGEKVGKETLLGLLNKDDKSRDILHRVLSNVMDEQSLRKRELYYCYLQNVENGIHQEFDYHTKLIMTINMITFEDLHILEQFKEHYKELVISAQNPTSDSEYTERRGVNVDEILRSGLLEVSDTHELEYSIERLSGYDLVYASHGRYDGTVFGPLTEFGKIFLDFVANIKKQDMEMVYEGK